METETIGTEENNIPHKQLGQNSLERFFDYLKKLRVCVNFSTFLL
jgi:hypothetical protein